MRDPEDDLIEAAVRLREAGFDRYFVTDIVHDVYDTPWEEPEPVLLGRAA